MLTAQHRGFLQAPQYNNSQEAPVLDGLDTLRELKPAADIATG